MSAARLGLALALIAGALVAGRAEAQPAPTRPPPASPRQAAPIDLTGQWVAIVNEDWRWRMVTPPKGDYASVPLNDEGRRVADQWDVSQDGRCEAYGAGALLLLQYPVQGRVGKCRIELGEELHILGAQLQRVDAVHARRSDHFGRIVDAKNDCAALNELPGEGALAAADVENPLARLWIEQVERSHAKLGDEAADARVIRCVPRAGRGGACVQSVAIHSR